MLREYNVFDDKGEMLQSFVSRVPPKIKGRWFFINCKGIRDFFVGCDSLVEVKLLLFLGSKMTYDEPWVKISRAELALRLSCSSASVDRAIASLVAKQLLFVGKVDGLVAFLLNPELMSKGGKSRQNHLLTWRKVTAADGGELQVLPVVDTETGEIIRREVADEDFGFDQEEGVVEENVDSNEGS